MNENNESRILIDTFKNDVKKKLPIWLKARVIELKDFLDELEDHIWDKASELAEGKDPEVWHVREAIIIMGNPRKIAKEFRTRGTPKFYITEELWPWFYKSLILVGIIVLFVNLLEMAFTLQGGNIGQVIGETFEGIFVGIVIGFAALGIVFVQLSYHGFLPEDFKRMAEPHMKPDKKIKKRKRPKSVLPSQGAYLFEGIFNLVGGAVFVFYPFVDINSFTQTYMELFFVHWLKLFGGVMILLGVIRFSQALVGKHIRLQQLFLALSLIPSSFSIALIFQLHVNPELIQTALSVPFDPVKVALYVKIIVIIVIISSILRMLDEIRKIYKLEIKGFPEEEYEEVINGN